MNIEGAEVQPELLGGADGGYQVSEMYGEACKDHVLLVVKEVWLLLLSGEHTEHETLFSDPHICRFLCLCLRHRFKKRSWLENI